jgi:orotidine-5'-phosphate decarboxylase
MITDKLRGKVGGFKIGLELLMTPEGMGFVKSLADTGDQVMADAKLKDIPNTVGAATRNIAHQGAAFVTVHASGGVEMMRAAVDNKGNTMKVLAVTVLTSMTDEVSTRSYGKPARDKVAEFVVDARTAGVDGIVCSPRELSIVKELAPDLETMIPGIRPLWAAVGDQKRPTTPGDAVKAGADRLVIGRPILKPPFDTVGSPENAVARIVEEIVAATN